MHALKRFKMTLRWDKVLLLLLVLAGLNVGLYVLSQGVYLKSFERLERQVAYDNLSRAFYSLYHDVDNLKLLATDWAEWDDTYRYMADRASAYLDSNLADDTLQSLQLNVFLLVAADGSPIVSHANDLTNVGNNPLDPDLEAYLIEQAQALLREDGEEAYAGLQHFKDRLMLLSVNPVLMSDGSGPARGALIMGRFADQAYLAELSFRIRMALGLEIWSEDKVLERLDRDLDTEPAKNESRLHFVTEAEEKKDHLRGYVLLQDFDGHFGPVLSLEVPRTIYREGQATARSFLFWSLLLSLCSGVLIYYIMDRLAQAIEREREQELKYRRLSTEFQTILDGIPDALTLLNASGKTVWGNLTAVRRDFGLSRDFQGRHLLEGETAGSVSGLSDVVASALNGGVQTESLEETEDGRKFRVKVFPIKGTDDSVTGAIKLAIDVTERMRLRQELEQNSRLAALGELSAGIAHEINNPNGMVQMNIGLVRDVWDDLQPILVELAEKHGSLRLGGLEYERLAEEFPVILDEMFKGTKKIREIVEDLKAFARKETNGLEEQVDLNETVLAAERLVAAQLRKSMAEYQSFFGTDLPPVRGSFRQLEQVVINLLVNACQAIEKPGAVIQVRTWYDVVRQQVVLVVKDEGRGIRREDLAKITDPFYTTRRDDGGTGLGLSVSQRIVNEHGGRLEFKSRPGQGTQVELRLPTYKESKS